MLAAYMTAYRPTTSLALPLRIYVSTPTVAMRRIKPANPATGPPTAMVTPTDLGAYWAQPAALSRDQP